MTAKACAWMLLLGLAGANAASAAPCYSDGDVVMLEGKVVRQAARQADAASKPAWVLSLASPICIAGATAGTQSNVSAVQIVDAEPPDDARVQLTGKLVTGNVSAYYAVPTAIWVLKQRVLSGR
ncbi:hypothetical protein [Caballeronia sp. ATUFL_M2_KS44]|uniref:hypothetical protein n=1 Tax=Caballeronia sp. ATUFL_M2_KS44 TaxID=2921767 RepID=UPI00202821E5|nr:hypothetical protein [Caballeronia sp. ATUFL_M2_KS44]